MLMHNLGLKFVTNLIGCFKKINKGNEAESEELIRPFLHKDADYFSQNCVAQIMKHK